jgi:hypothetical protein
LTAPPPQRRQRYYRRKPRGAAFGCALPAERGPAHSASWVCTRQRRAHSAWRRPFGRAPVDVRYSPRAPVALAAYIGDIGSRIVREAPGLNRARILTFPNSSLGHSTRRRDVPAIDTNKKRRYSYDIGAPSERRERERERESERERARESERPLPPNRKTSGAVRHRYVCASSVYAGFVSAARKFGSCICFPCRWQEAGNRWDALRTKNVVYRTRKWSTGRAPAATSASEIVSGVRCRWGEGREKRRRKRAVGAAQHE